MKRLLLFFLLTIITGSIVEAESTKALEKVSLQLHWKYQFEFAGFIAAKEKGYYKDVGLDVTLKEYAYGIDIPKNVLGGISEYGIYNSHILINYLNNKPIKLVASYFKRAALVLITNPEIKSPKDLIGKKIMATTKEDFILNFQPYFNHYNTSIDDVELVPHSYCIDDFVSGKVSAMTAFISDQLYKLDDENITYNVLSPSDENLFVLQLELFTSAKEIEHHPKRVLAFAQASKKGWEYALSHKKEIANIIVTKYSTNISLKDLLREADGIEKLILPYTYEIGSVNNSFLEKQIEIFKQYYHMKSEKNVKDFVFQRPKNRKDIFTQRELDYINRHPVIDVCLQYNQFPIDGYINGKMSGIASDIYKLIENRTSFKFHPIPSSSDKDLDENLRANKCQILSLYATDNNTRTTLKPTKSFLKTNFTIVSKLDKSFTIDEESLRGKILVTQLVDFKNYLIHFYPYLNIIVENNQAKMMRMILDDKVYGVVTLNEKADYLIEKYGYSKLKVNGFLAKEHPFKGSIGVDKSQIVLYSIIQKSLNTISQNQIANILESWRLSRYREVTDFKLLIILLVVALIIFLIMGYYQKKLRSFNHRLEEQVHFKTKELRKLNENLVELVDEKVKELVQKDKILTIQSKHAVMGEMISMIAHQWRQPLSTITLQISNLQLEEMMGKKRKKERVDNLLNDISERIIYLSETIDDFKTYFHPDRKTNTTTLPEILHKILSLVSARMKEENVSIQLACSCEAELQIYSNELVQVILNILNNAIDAYASTVPKEKVIFLECSSDDKTFKISVRDEAGGISQENLKKIFDPYFSTKGKNGTGLGLYMSKMIIEKQFKGNIDVQTSPNGTKFIVSALKNLE